MRRETVKLPHWNVKNKRVLLRIDGNVPLKNGVIFDSFKLDAVKKTIDFLKNHGAYITILTHIGNPTERSESLSTRILLPWFLKNGYAPDYVSSPKDLTLQNDRPFILFENVRFFSGEKNRDPAFAAALAYNADYFVNDAFGVLHRSDTSITLLPQLFEKKTRSIGFLVESELKQLAPLQKNPIQPFVIILGGGKAESKAQFLPGLMKLADTILICPTLSESKIVQEKKSEKVIFPSDFYQLDNKIISIGTKTTDLYISIIKQAKTILWNGMMGFLDKPETLDASRTVATALIKNSGYTVVAGGDTTAFIRHCCPEWQKISALSTGGGSTLFLLAENKLPGLESL